MTQLKVAIMILFLICMFAAGHSGGPFILAEIGLLIELASGHAEGLIAIPVISLQIAGFLAISRSNDQLMFMVVILLSLIVIAATIISHENLSVVIWTNGGFLVAVAFYVVLYLREKKQAAIEAELVE